MSRAFAGWLALCLVVASSDVLGGEVLRFGRFGELTVTRETADPARAAIVLSGDEGWNARAKSLAESLAAHDALVIGVDSRTYLAALASGSDGCAYPAGELEALSQFVQKKLAMRRYVVPTLVGIGSGAWLAHAALAQAPLNTFRAGLGLDPPAARTPVRPFCGSHRAVSDPEPSWRAFSGASGGDPASALVAAFARDADDAGSSPTQLSASVSDLPLVAVAARGTPADAFAVILSGDGGWASLDREVGGALAERGVPVLGFDSLQYFWTRRTPEESASALARVLRHALGEWPDRRIALVGYSRGADVLPFMVSRLPADLRARVALVVLIGPARSVEFEFHVSDWLGRSDPDAGLPIAPEIAKLRGLRILCIYGRDEDESACRGLDPALATRDERAGGHHFDGDYEAIGERIAREIAR